LLIPFYMVPFCVGAVVLLTLDHKLAAPIVWGTAGLTTGFGSNLKQAIWAEVYGTQHLGAIRSMLTPLTVLATALAPPMFSFGLDHGLDFDQLVWISLGVIVGFTALAALTLFQKPMGYDGHCE